MSLYSVLLVDDEEEVLQIMMKKLDWESMGFRIIGYAKNGEEALEIAEEYQPDVVMTDIKMPFMDGLTLCKKLKEAYQKIKLIILSGFDEFEYAKEAIKAEVEEYILKPINSNELREVFDRIKSALDRELDEKRNIEKLRKYYLESLPILQESFYTSLLEGRISENKIDYYLKNYQIDLKGELYAVTILHISSELQKTSGQNNDLADPFLQTVSVKKLAEEQLAGKWDFKTITYLGDIIVITAFEDTDSINHYTDLMDRICKMTKRICNVCITAGIGQACLYMHQLHFSYEGAKNAVSYRVIYGNNRAINITEMDPNSHNDIPWEEPYIRQIFKQIKTGDVGTIKAAVDEFVGNMSSIKMSLQRYRILLMILITEIYKFGNANQIDMKKVFKEEKDVYVHTLQLESSNSLIHWLCDSCIKMHNLVRAERQNINTSFVTKAVEYVEEHYSDDDLTIDVICRYLNVSAAYFSTIFKKETGKTFINYLTQYRMDQAVEMLEYGDDKTHIIAGKVGYSDPNYFSYAFKKKFGISPSKYRMNKRVVS